MDSRAQNPAFLAHSANAARRSHALKDHLASVAALAGRFMRGLPGADDVVLAGLLHDLGKYGDLFQDRLRGEAEGLDHWSQGAWVAVRNLRSIAAALSIQGHHIGLQRADKTSLLALEPGALAKNHPLGLRLSEADTELLLTRLQADGLPLPPAAPPGRAPCGVADMLDVRMIFSALVDADFLDTEAHFNGTAEGKRYRSEGAALRAESAIALLEKRVASLRAERTCERMVQEVRDRLWEAARSAGRLPTGPWTLTAPTGSGKTLAMLRFALEQARAHGLSRIVVAIPFLNIVEQTAAVYRELLEPELGEQYVLEDHSLAGLGVESGKGDAESPQERTRRILAQNWDAPLVVTTNVQLLQSLFSNRPSACRKLHRLAGSVIVFDEAQTLPPALAVPTLAALSRLCAGYGSSVVFATATQPAFDHLDGQVQEAGSAAGWAPRTVVPDDAALFKALRRVVVRWPAPDAKTSPAELAGRLAGHEQVLCIVNLKRHAAAVLNALRERGVLALHLSTNMCAAHRRDALRTVREKLAAAEPCRVVSTQCVEAGVDVDFPVVYRALGPLDALAQSAGRCNRNGLLRDGGGRPRPGELHVFVPERDASDEQRTYPSPGYFQAACVVQGLLAQSAPAGLDLDDPAVYRTYFQRLYDTARPQDSSRARAVSEACTGGSFVDAAKEYRIIDQDAIQVLVPYAKRQALWDQLRAELSQRGLTADWMRRAQELCVGVFRPKHGHPLWSVIAPARLAGGGESSDWFFLLEGHEGYYDEDLGLVPPQGQAVLIG